MSKYEKLRSVVAGIFCENLQFTREVVTKMMIGNMHRLPVREDQGEKTEDDKRPPPPPAIIVKFLCMSHRDAILDAASYKNLKGSGISIRTDLPLVLKRKRDELATIAYKLRRDEKVQTIIRERPNRVWLETRRNASDKWKAFTLDSDSDE